MLRNSRWWKVAVVAPLACAAWAGTFGKVVSIGGQAADIALDEARGVLYVANFTANRIEVVSLADYTIQTSINVAPQPSSIALSPDGHYLVITHYGNFTAPAPPSNALTVVDLTNSGKQTFALANPPLGVAFGADGKALIVTTTDYLLFDPVLGTTQEIGTIAGVVAKTLPVPPANFPPQITNASVAVSGDGWTIYGIGGASATFTFRYDVGTQNVRPGGIVIASGTFGPRVVSLNQDGSLIMAGWVLIDNQGHFTHLLQSANQLNVGSTAFDTNRALVYSQMPATAGEAPVLKILDVDNFATLERLQLPENLAGKSLLSSDGNTLYSVSDSGVLVMPIGSLSRMPRVIASQQDVIFRGSSCSRGKATQLLNIVNPGGGATPFSITSLTAGITVSPASGTTPMQVQVTVDPTVFQNQKGTSVGTLQISSAQAMNVIPTVRVLVNNHDPSQRGAIVDIPGTISDLLADPVRNRYYLLRQDTNQLLVFDSTNNNLITTLKTGNVPKGLAITFDQRYLLVANDSTQYVSVFDLETLQSAPPIYITGYTAHSVAASAGAILAAATDYQGVGRIMRLDLNDGSGVQLPSLGVFNNIINTNSVVVASPNGSSIMVAEADGNLLLYDANADSFTVSRKDVTSLSGAYAASAFQQYVVGNSLLDSSLVPVLQFNAGSNASSGFAFVDQGGYLTTVPVAATGTGTGTGGTGGTTTLSSVAGSIQRVDLSNSKVSMSLATSMIEAPLLGTTTNAFTRTIAPLYTRNAIVNLTVSGFTVLPWQFDASVAPPKISSVVNAADGGKAIAPGGLISIYGTQFSPVNVATNEIPVPTALADSCLAVNGLPVPIFFVSPTQINAQMPFAMIGSVTMILRTPGGTSDNFNLTVLPNAPSVFRANVEGLGSEVATIVRDINGELVTPSNPVHKNDSLVIYLTGLGITNPASQDGTPGALDPLADAIVPPTVTLGGSNLALQYAGMAPGEVGVYQINVKVPSSIQSGLSIPLIISQGGMGTTIQVRVVD
jgi:uncharacterized protein (TIGR03437 family)